MNARESTGEMLGRVCVSPAPAPEELAAILAALRVRQRRQHGGQPARRPSPWLRAARREAMRGSVPHPPAPAPNAWERG